jgi:hypothetical protein
VKDIETDEPIFGANVFIENSTVGATTDTAGKYMINNISSSSFQNIVVSHLAYQAKSIPLQGRKVIDFKLKPKTTVLSEVAVEQERDRKWKRLYKQFEKEFIGPTENAGYVQINNPWTMELAKNKAGELNGFSYDLLEIENRATGYQINFLVENFTRSGEEVKYIGKPYFTPLKASTKEEQIKWNEARKKAYLGSRRHFLYALSQDRLWEEGFIIYNAEFDQRQGIFKTQDRLSKQDIWQEGRLNFKRFLKVVYTKEKPEREFVKAFSSSTRIETGRNQSFELEDATQAKSQISYLFVKTSRGVQVNDEGVLKNPEYVLEYGYWSWERIAELIPYEYRVDLAQPTKKAKPKPISQITSSQESKRIIPLKNGFDLSNASLPLAEFVQGAPSKNAIPPITAPQFKIAKEVTWLRPDSQLIGVEFNGLVRAYPLEIMNRHEIVNDDFDGQAIAITYCPLCGSGMAFSRKIDQKTLSFGVSGLLLNNNLLFYDQESLSLWSQINMKGLTGKYKDYLLEAIPVTHTTWAEWRGKHPNSEVLTRATGYNFKYQEAAYVGYHKTDEIPFAIRAESSELKAKDVVLGVSTDGQYKAYPLKYLKKKKSPLDDVIGSTNITITYDKKTQQALIRSQTGQEILSMKLYWFAWYAFYPETEIYKN